MNFHTVSAEDILTGEPVIYSDGDCSWCLELDDDVICVWHRAQDAAIEQFRRNVELMATDGDVWSEVSGAAND